MFALLIAIATIYVLDMIAYLIHIGEGKPVIRTPASYVAPFIATSALLAFVIYAILNWV